MDPARESALLAQLSKWLRELRVTSAARFPLMATVRKCGPSCLSSSEIKFSAPSRIISSDASPIEIRKGETLEIDFLLSWGKGKVPAEKARLSEDHPRGWVALDRSHSPVRRMRLDTVVIEVGQFSGCEQVIAEITTDGSISPEDALRRAGNYIKLPPRPLAG